MSTKIYNGFRMKNLKANEMIGFLNELREKIEPEIHKAFCDGVIKICRVLISKAIRYDISFDGTSESVKNIEEKYIRSWYLASLTTPAMAQKALRDIDDVVEDLEWPFLGGIINLAVNIYRNDTLNESNVSCYNDIRSQISFLRGDDTHLLFITFGNAFTDILFKLIQNEDEFVAAYKIEEYGYWNNADPPENISDIEWEKREKDWNKALPGLGISARCGLCSCNIFNDEDMFSIFKMANDGRTEYIMKYMPSIDDLVSSVAHDETINHFVQNYVSSHGDQGPVYELCVQYSEKLKGGDEDMIRYSDNLIQEMKDQLPKRSVEQILSGSILWFLPKYMAWRELKKEGANSE